MEKLANITQNDINNGVLNRMLVNAGISDVQEYVKKFHQETEQLIIEEFKHPDLNQTNNDEQIAPPADVQSWIMGLRLRLDDPIQPPLPEQQELQKQQPADLQSWMHGMIPSNMHPSTDNTAPEISTTSTEDSAVTGNLGTWLTDWSKSLTEQPPPKSLDDWLQGLIPTNMYEPIEKTNNSKVRLNSYLNAAQKVLSEHGYNVSNEIKPSNNIPTKVGMFGNVKQMYFLWKTLDKNNDRKITVEDVQIMLEEMGLGFLSKHVGQTLFDMVDTDHDGTLKFRDFIALMSIIKQLMSAIASAKA